MTSLWLALAAGAGMIFFLVKSRWNYSRLPELRESKTRGRAGVCIIIPARNEEANITRAVRSVGRFRVYVVDDGSTDQTALRARKAGATVMQAPPPAAGFVGKPQACWTGARATASEWLLFLDADTWVEPRFVDSLVEHAAGKSLDVASVFLRQECGTTAEKALLPYWRALQFCGVNAAAVASPTRREVLANGQCMLFRREAYNYSGGHAAVMGSLLDDLDLAHIAKRHGMRVGVLRAERLGAVRGYPDWRLLRRGLQRNSLRFLLTRPWACVQIVLTSLLLACYLPLIVYLGYEGWWIAALPLAVLPSILLKPWYGTWKWALLAPLGVYGFAYILLRAVAAALLRRPVEWKGRRY